jgi:RNA polymerase sigma-70 factor, ECF subfamily
VDTLKRRLLAVVPRVRAFGIHLARSYEVADNLIVQIIQSAWDAKDTIRSDAEFEVWMVRAFRNLYFDDRRKGAVPPDASVVDAPVPFQPGMEVAHDALTIDRVRRAVWLLDDNHREAALLVCASGFSYATAANIMRLTADAVEHLVKEVRERIPELAALNPH